MGKKEVILGDNPSRNYTELARKFPHFFSISNMTENFDQGLFQVAYSLAESFYSDQNLIKLSKRLETFKHLEIMKKFEEFYALFFQKDKLYILYNRLMGLLPPHPDILRCRTIPSLWTVGYH